jgi:hypothetical protein
MADYQIKDIYQGGYSTLDPEYGKLFTGYRVPVRDLGITTNPTEARIAHEVSNKINMGAKNVEVEILIPKTFDAMNKHDFKEINRISKLTGVDMSFHGPLVEASGMTQQGFTEAEREGAERQIAESMERIHDANPKGGIVNFHSSNMFPAPDVRMIEKDGKRIEEIDSVIVINTKDGGSAKIKLKERHFPGEEGEMDIKKEIAHYNQQSWDGQLTNLGYSADRATEFIKVAGPKAVIAHTEKKSGVELSPEKKQAIQQFNIGRNYLSDSYRQLQDMYETAYENSTPEEKTMLENLSKKIKSKAERIKEEIKKDPKSIRSIELKKEIIEEGLDTFGDISAPKLFKPIDEFMMEKTSTTFGNAAFKTYKKFGDNSPVMVIENPPASQQFSRAKDIKDIVEKSRKQFVEQAIKEGISKSEARRESEKLIGASWDVGHINMLRKSGFSEKDILKETEIVKPFVKHVHLSDNFGFEHTELPMGMGNVPFKKIMKKLGKQGFEAKKIIEAGDWWTQHFPKGGVMPFTPSLEAMGSPMYAVDMQPYWNQSVGLQQEYISQQGATLPDVNFQTLGGGFSQLPMELGGQMPGAQGSRTSGRGME